MSQTIKVPESVFINLCKILQLAKKIISLDGDFENRAYDFMTYFGNIIVMENTIKKNIKHFNLISSPVTFNNKLEEDLKNGKNIFLVCLSATIATRYNNTYAKYNPILFCADMDDNIKKKLLNVEKEWIKHQLVIITPCVESGVSFNVPHFYKQYAIINDKSTSPRGLMQMLGRVRQLEVYDVDVFINNLPTTNNNCFFTFDEVKDYVKYIKRPYYKDIKELTLYDTINIHNHVEKANKSRNIFIPYFLHLCDIKGHTYKLDEIKCAPETKSSIYDKKSILDKAILVTTEEAANIMTNIIKNNASQLEKYSYEKYMYAIHWKLDCIGDNSLIFYGRTLNVSKTVFESDFFEKWYGKTYVLYNLRNYLSGNTIKVHDNASTIVNFKDLEDDTKIKLVRGLLADLGLAVFGTIVDDVAMKKNIINTITNNKVFNDKEVTLLFGKGKYSINSMVLNYNKKRHDGKFIQYINQHILVNYGMTININNKTLRIGKKIAHSRKYNLAYVDNINKYI